MKAAAADVERDAWRFTAPGRRWRRLLANTAAADQAANSARKAAQTLRGPTSQTRKTNKTE